MSVDRTVYIGWYLKVWMPKESTDTGKRVCPACRTTRYHEKFCSICGKELTIKEDEIPLDVYDYLDKVFGEECGESYFTFEHSSPFEEQKEDFVVILPNNSDMKCGYYLDEHEFEQPLAFGQVTHRAWCTLTDSLAEDGIKHQFVCGVINYYS